jgi:hypothetical protein
MEKLKAMTEDQIQEIASDAVQGAINFVESEIAEERIKSQRYFEGEVDIGEEDGRSKIVSTKVRDTIRSIKPSLMRVFLSSENPVEFIPTSQEDVKMAEQATKYAHWRFTELNGYRLLNDVIHDALVKKTGVLKIWWEDKTDSEIHSYSNVTDEEMLLIVNDDNVEVLEHSTEVVMDMDEMGVEMERPEHSLKISHKTESGEMKIEALPPEEFVVDRNAKSVENAYVVAHRTEMRVTDLVEMGYDFDEISELSGLSSDDAYSDAEDFERRGYQQDDEESSDSSMKKVQVTEAYMKMDKEGTGIATMYRILLAGGENKLLECEPWGEIPFAIFEIDPEPHTFFGRSVADLIMTDQDSSTAMLRGLMDNVALTNSPRQGYVQGQVNVDDLMNNEIGGLVRLKSPQALVDIATPFVAGQVLSAIQYMDMTVESKTGVSKASIGLDPDALQNTSATAARLQAQQGSAQIEVMARNLAEGGMKRLFKLMLKLCVENSNEESMMRLHGQFQPIDPRTWNAEMDVSINVGLGTGREEQKQAALGQALQMQMQIWSSYGASNGLVTMTGIRNTLGDMLALNGIRNIDRYFNPMTHEQEQMLIQHQQEMESQQPETSPEADALVEAEKYKADKKAETEVLKVQMDAQKAQLGAQKDSQIAQIEIQKASQKAEIDAQRAQIEVKKAEAIDDRERDKLDQELIIKTAEILGRYGQAVDTAKIRQEQAKQRNGGRF